MRYTAKSFIEVSENRSKNFFVVFNFFHFFDHHWKAEKKSETALKLWQKRFKIFIYFWCIHLTYNFDILDKILTGLHSYSYAFYPFLYTGTTSAHLISSGKKALSKHSLKFLARKPPKMSLNFLIILSGMSLDFETFLESDRLITMDICS